MSNQTNSVNFYEGYLARTKKARDDKTAKTLTIVLPLALMALALLGVAGKFLLDNRAKQAKIDALDARISELNAAYETADARAERLSDAQTELDTLSANRVMFNLYPVLTRDTLVQVRACATGFTISDFTFDETTGVLGVKASSDSVNEVPAFVQRLRATGLFSKVQYTGYVSDADQVYHCTIDCTLEPPTVTGEEMGIFADEANPEWDEETGEDAA